MKVAIGSKYVNRPWGGGNLFVKNLSKYLNQFRNLDCIKKTTFDDHIKRHYFFSHESINPTRIIPIGPIVS